MALRKLLRTRWVLAVLVVELLVAAMVVYGLWALRRQTLESELRMLASLSAAMATQADATLDVANAALLATRAELAEGLIQPGSEATRAFLRARAASLPQFRALTLVDAQGMRIATSRTDPVPPNSVADRDFFQAARESAEPMLFVGSPYFSRSDGKPAIGISMGWRGADGEFKGLINLIADPEFLDGDFSRIAPTHDTSLAIYRRDRELVSDGPGDGSAQLLPSGVMDALWSGPSPDSPRVMTLHDGRKRLVAAHLLERFPLMVVVTRDMQAVLADWTEQAWLIGSFAASALSVTLLLTLRSGREQAMRQASEAALAEEQERAVRAFHAAQEGHWEWNPVTGQSHMSPRMKELLGIDRDAPADGRPALLERGTLHPDDILPLRDAFLAHQEGRSPDFNFTFRVRHPDGRWHHVRTRGYAWRDADGHPSLFSGTASDVTAEVEGLEEKRRLEDDLQRARKLEALARWPGASPTISTTSSRHRRIREMARESPTAGSGQARHLDQVLQAGLRGKALVERILSFSRGAPDPIASFQLQPVVEEVLPLLVASLRPRSASTAARRARQPPDRRRHDRLRSRDEPVHECHAGHAGGAN